MVDVNKLRGKMVERNKAVNDLAGAIGMSKATFYRKLYNNGETFTIREADIISKELKFDINEVNSIFFSQFVALYANKMGS